MPYREDLDYLDPSESISQLEHGEWCYDAGVIIARLPAPGGLWRNSKTSPWTVTGPKEAPTVTPSLHQWYEHPETKERVTMWHGWLTNGEWVSC